MHECLRIALGNMANSFGMSSLCCAAVSDHPLIAVIYAVLTEPYWVGFITMPVCHAHPTQHIAELVVP